MSISSQDLKKLRQKHNLSRVQMAYIMRMSFESYEIREKGFLPVEEQEEKFLRKFFDISEQERIEASKDCNDFMDKHPQHYRIERTLTIGDKLRLFRMYHQFTIIHMARLFCIPLTDYLELEQDIRKPDDGILNVFCDFFGNTAKNVLLTELSPEIMDAILG